MVTSTSIPVNNGATHENEKRRKQTVERAKANHLSRQLQMRLQYARLKVDHGWQKQNLNEVENLYFHHSHQRGPKPYTPGSSPSMVTTIPPPATAPTSLSMVATTSTALPPPPPIATVSPWYQLPEEPTPPHQIPMSFKLGASSKSEQLYKMTESQLGQSRSFSAGSPLPEDGVPTTSSNILEPTSTYNPASSNQSASGPPYDHMQLTRHVPSPAPGPSSNHYPNVLYRQPQTQSSQSSMGTSDNSFSFPGVSLTYDSFWSSHSHSSSAASHSFRASPGSTVPGGELSEVASDLAVSKAYQAGVVGARGGRRKMAARATAGREG
ncbi:hypothetical protein FPV67DRAFT_1214931 [Lyophyllum atratum]|nr:hypothetical protein FPV67DRAFT_1214931 [Lyophyllum atratum]